MSASEVSYGYLNNDVVCYMMQFVDVLQLNPVSRVCTLWKQNVDEMLKAWHENAWLFVEEDKYSPESWIVLNATRGGKDPRAAWTKYLGKPIGTPKATLEQIKMLWKDKRYLRFSAVYIFEATKRPVCETESASVEWTGRLKIIPARPETSETKAEEVIVGTSIPNLIELFNHPLEGKENCPVFREDYPQQIPGQLYHCLKTSSVVFVTREIHTESLNKPWIEQTKHLSAAGIFPLIILKGFERLETGTCAWQENYAQCPETVQIAGKMEHLALGGFSVQNGFDLNSNDGEALESIGVVECIPPESSKSPQDQTQQYREPVPKKPKWRKQNPFII